MGEESLRNTCNWLAQGWDIVKACESNSEAPQAFVKAKLKLLKSVLPALYKTQQNVEHFLLRIFEVAQNLETMFGSSRAIFTFVGYDGSGQGQLQYSEENMEAVSWNSPLSNSSTVSFIISPLLVKRGNADGHNYSSRMVLEKARVCCN